MNTIGLIDDRNDQREALRLGIKLELEKNFNDWSIIDSKPLPKKSDYQNWIIENDISVLILDERLNEEKIDDGTFVPYLGSELVQELRNVFKDLPIYCVTNVEVNEKLKASLHYFNLIISKATFDDDLENYLNSFIKSGIKFYTNYKKELERLSELSQKLALGTATTDESDEARSLQMRLMIPYVSDDIDSRKKKLDNLQSELNEIQELKEKLKKHLENNS